MQILSDVHGLRVHLGYELPLQACCERLMPMACVNYREAASEGMLRRLFLHAVYAGV